MYKRQGLNLEAPPSSFRAPAPWYEVGLCVLPLLSASAILPAIFARDPQLAAGVSDGEVVCPLVLGVDWFNAAASICCFAILYVLMLTPLSTPPLREI